ncbi:MAG: glycosyltransferase family 2 protein [Halioglobus sp.]
MEENEFREFQLAPMNVHAYILTYNDERIIGGTLSHYAEFCSRIFLMDNMSSDKTVEIAKTFANVTIIPWSMENYDERMLVKMKTRTYKDFSRRGGQHTTEVADWIIVCDADEILYHPEITQLLERYSSAGITVPQTTGFNMIDETDILPGASLTANYRNGIRTNRFDKRIIFSSEFDMHYSAGCHPRGNGFELMKREWNYRPSDGSELAVLHYKYIGNWAHEKAALYLEKGVNSEGGAASIPHHYHTLGSDEFTVPDSHGRARQIIVDDGSIQFESFAKTSGESGIDPLLPHRQEYGSTLADLASSLENLDLPGHIDDCISLMTVASACRPKNQHYKRRLREYRQEKSKSVKKGQPES